MSDYSVFSTINRHPRLLSNHPHIDYNPQTTFARVHRGFEHVFVNECKRLNIQYMTYPPNFTV